MLSLAGIASAVIYDYFKTKENNLVLETVVSTQRQIIKNQEQITKISNETITSLHANDKAINNDYKAINNDIKKYFNYHNDSKLDKQLLAIYNKAISDTTETTGTTSGANGATVEIKTSELMQNVIENYNNYMLNYNKVIAWQSWYTKIKQELNNEN